MVVHPCSMLRPTLNRGTECVMQSDRLTKWFLLRTATIIFIIHRLTREAMNNIVHFLEKVSRDHNHNIRNSPIQHLLNVEATHKRYVLLGSKS